MNGGPWIAPQIDLFPCVAVTLKVIAALVVKLKTHAIYVPVPNEITSSGRNP